MGTFRVPVNLTWDGLGSPGANVWHVRTSNTQVGGDSAELQDGVNAIRAFYEYLRQSGTTPASLWRTGLVITLGEVVNLETDEQATPSWSQITQGENGADAPESLQICVSWRTSIRARRGMGRTFVGPLCAAAIDLDGTPKPGVVTMAQAAASNLVSASESGIGWAVCIRGQQVSTPGASPEQRATEPKVLRDLQQARVKDKFSILRSRRD